MRTVYLDNAATSFPKPPRVYERLRSYLEEFGGCPGRGSYEMARQAEAVIAETRELLAELFHVGEPRRIVFTLNATDALNMAIKGALRPGDHVVTTVLEHNSVARPLNRLEREGLIRVTRVGASPEGLIDPADIRGALNVGLKAILKDSCYYEHDDSIVPTGKISSWDTIGVMVREISVQSSFSAIGTTGCILIR